MIARSLACMHFDVSNFVKAWVLLLVRADRAGANEETDAFERIMLAGVDIRLVQDIRVATNMVGWSPRANRETVSRNVGVRPNRSKDAKMRTTADALPIANGIETRRTLMSTQENYLHLRKRPSTIGEAVVAER